MENKLQDLDWVRERFSCSLAKIFETLKLHVESDVSSRNALREPGTPYKFSLTNHGNTFTVFSESSSPIKSVVFALLDRSISVSDGDRGKMFEATITLNDEGQCKAKINGQERELWQMRRMALEKLFFETF